jgi:hypothetical protein
MVGHEELVEQDGVLVHQHVWQLLCLPACP